MTDEQLDKLVKIVALYSEVSGQKWELKFSEGTAKLFTVIDGEETVVADNIIHPFTAHWFLQSRNIVQFLYNVVQEQDALIYKLVAQITEEDLGAGTVEPVMTTEQRQEFEDQTIKDMFGVETVEEFTDMLDPSQFTVNPYTTYQLPETCRYRWDDPDGCAFGRRDRG